jgi:hybrid cluster-associated redox disulfide protein
MISLPSAPVISPDLTVQQFLDRWPQAVPFFLRSRLSCVGCPMARFDTLRDVARIYHLRLPALLSDLEWLLQSSV